MTRTWKTALLGFALLAAAPAAAERNWILPVATIFSGAEGWASFDAGNSGDIFFADHRPLALEQFKVWQPDGTPGKVQNGSTLRRRTVFDVQLDKPGTWRISTVSTNVFGSFKVNGEEKRVGGRGGPPPGGAGPAAAVPQRALTIADIPADATDVKLTQIINRNDVFVTLGEPTRTVFAPTGRGLEFDPITHPDELIMGEAARFRFLVDGKPAPSLHVTIVPGGTRYRNAENALELTTGKDGIVTVKWPGAGLYWLGASLTDSKATEPRISERRMNYSATIEVLTP